MKRNLILAIIGIIFLVNSSLVTGINDYNDNQGSTVDGVIHSNPSAGNKIAVTLDVDGSNLDTDLITLLIYNDIPITLFVNTKYLIANKETFLSLKSSHPDLVEFENHGAEHKACILGTEKVYNQEPAGTKEGMTNEIKDAADAIQTDLGVTTKYYRPGTGAADAACVETAKELGHSVVDWSVNGDHGAGSAITADAVKNDWLSVQAGGIIVSHLNKPQGNTYEGAKEAIPLLKKKGFTFVKLEELLGYTTGAAASTPPSKGASLSAEVPESIFTLNFDKYPAENLQFKYDLTENHWLVSAACNLKEGIASSPEEASDFIDISKFLERCKDTNLNMIIADAIFSGTETFEEGKEALCSYYAEDSIKQKFGASLWIDEKKILPLTNAGGTEEELRLEITESCLDQMYMAVEEGVTPEIEAEEVSKDDEEEQATVSSAISSVTSCSECKEIDLVWKEVGKLLQISMALAEKVWQGTAGWLDFNTVYAPSISPTPSSSVKPSEKDISNLNEIYEKYKFAIDAASVQYNIDKSLLVAFIYVESKGKQYALSCSGAGGVMQFLGSTAKGYDLSVPDYAKVDVVLAPNTKCEGKTAGETMTVPCCSSRVPKVQQCCAYQSDERFNPSKAIPAAAKYLKSMKDLSLENKKKKDSSSWIVSNDENSEESKLKFAIFHYRGGWNRPGVQENYYDIIMNKKAAAENAGVK